MRRPFPYAARAQAVEQASRAVNAAARQWRLDRADNSRRDWDAWVERFHAAIELAYPPGFWSDFERLRAGDVEGLGAAVDFLEADPMFFRSGYVKAELVKLVKRLPLSDDQVSRLRTFVFGVVRTRDDRDFRDFCRLAPRLDGPAFRAELRAIAAELDRDVSRRARWVLDALEQAERTRAGAR